MFSKRLLLASAAALFFIEPAAAQNTTCSNRPNGDSSNACANTRFVATNALPAIAGLFVAGTTAYPTLQSAVAAARAYGNGTTVWVPCGQYGLGSGATGLDVSGSSALRITGISGVNGGAGQCVQLNYAGTGNMINADLAYGFELDHVTLVSTGGGSTLIQGSNSFALNVHDVMLSNTNSNASNIGISLDNSQGAKIDRVGFSIQGGIGVRGVAPAGSFSVNTNIMNSTFFSTTPTSISSPGQVWNITRNIAQNPTTFIAAGPATTCDIVNIVGNDIDDIVGGAGKTMITSNCSVTNSRSNRFGYISGTVTDISQTNTTGTVSSIGDRLSGTVGIAIGTGNYLNIEGYDQAAPNIPTTLYTGTPANTNIIKTVGGAVNITGQTTLGLEGSIAGSLRFKNATAGTNVTLAPAAGALGSVSNTLPSTSGTVLNTTNNVNVASKVFDNTNIYTTRDDRFTLQDNGDTTKQAVFDLAGITTATTRTFTLPNASGTMTLLGLAQTWTALQTFSSGANVTNLDVTGTNTTTRNQNGSSFIQMLNNDAGASSNSFFRASNGTNTIDFGIGGTGRSTFGQLQAGRGYFYGATDTVLAADNANLIFATVASANISGKFWPSGCFSVATGTGQLDCGANGIQSNGAVATRPAATFTGTSGTLNASESVAIFNPSGAFTATLPTCNAAAAGRWLEVKTIAAQTVSSASSNVIPRTGGAAGTPILAAASGNWARMQCNGTNWEIISGS